MQQLPAKDQAVFRSIVKFYESKLYKKGVKAADTILKKHPDHGETLCMKGLTLSYLDPKKKDEAYELVRRGLKNDLKSHVCWHVLGLLYRQDRDYSEAVKCYRSALRFDPENIQILRDLSLLQIHRRDLAGFAETRRKLLQAKPSNRLNWIGCAVAEHLCKSHEFAWTCIDNYEKTFKEETVPEYENSELFLYKAGIMEEAGKFEEALECLKQHENEIVDKLNMMEIKGRICMFLKRFDEAAEIFRKLIDWNPEHHMYILGYMANQPRFQRFWPPLPAPKIHGEGDDQELPSTLSSFPPSLHPEGTPIWGWLPPEHTLKAQRRVAIGTRQHKQRADMYQPACTLTDEEEASVEALFDELREAYPKSDSLQRLLLYFVSGHRFKKRIDVYLRRCLNKGIPSLFRMLRPLYFQDGKYKLVEELVNQYMAHLQEDVAWFGPAPGETGSPPDPEKEEPPSTILFTWMLAAQHFDFLGDTQKALEFVDKAIDHTPTFVEAYACKARIYKHAGDLERSAEWFEEVRSMDLADRFLNTQCVRALLRVDEIQGGMEKALLFSHSKEPEAPDAANLHDMQCMWFESAVGRSYARQRNHGKALKEFGETFKHFSDIAEDQFDFHNYCLRKTTLKAYVAMLRMQERLYSHKFYRRVAKDVIRIYLEIYDKKASGDASAVANDEEEKDAEATAAEKRKMKHKNKRAKKKVEESAVSKSGATGKPKKVDDDPDGEKLLEKDPMEESSKLVKNLVLYSSLDPVTHVITYDVFSRQGKWLHCLQALIQQWKLAKKDKMNYKLISNLAHFCFVAKLEDAEMPAAVKEVILSELAVVLGASDPFADIAAMRASASSFVDAVQSRLRNDAELPVIEVLYSLKCLKHAGRDCKSLLEDWRPTAAFSLKECYKMLKYLGEEFGEDSTIKAKFKERCMEAFPLMVIA
jgi:peptide alpha-N-acetyltransferase